MWAVERLDVDVLVVGAGLAGLRAALAARHAGATRVLLAVKGKAGRSGSSAMTTAAYAGVLPSAIRPTGLYSMFPIPCGAARGLRIPSWWRCCAKTRHGELPHWRNPAVPSNATANAIG